MKWQQVPDLCKGKILLKNMTRRVDVDYIDGFKFELPLLLAYECFYIGVN